VEGLLPLLGVEEMDQDQEGEVDINLGAQGASRLCSTRGSSLIQFNSRGYKLQAIFFNINTRVLICEIKSLQFLI